MKTKFIFTLAFLALLISPTAKAQYQSFGLSVSPMQIRGDLINNMTDFSGIGIDLGLSAYRTFFNERWKVMLEMNYYTAKQTRSWNSEAFTSNISATSILVGARYILTDDVIEYNPYTGQIIPFIGLAPGVTFSNAQVTRIPNDTESLFKTQDKVSNIAIEGQIGAEIVFTHQISGIVFLGSRYVPSDFLDGVQGTSNWNDAMFRLGLGFVYNIR